MHTFRVWAPRPGKVSVHLKAGDFPAKSMGNGWWEATVAAASGDDYGFILDGQGPLPDPRSSWQPEGVLGLSRLVDHAAFSWSDFHWQAPPLSSALIYELHVGTFTEAGTFTAVIDKLDYLKGLGVTHVEIMPVNEFPGGRGWGYDGVDLFAPHHAYGGPEGLKQLVDACHNRNLAVLLDVVYNHLGPAGNFLPRYGPYFTDRYSTPWGEAVNFDGPGSDEVRRFFCDNALMWLRDYHMDGLRLDAVHAICDSSAEPFLAQLTGEVKQLESHLGRHFVIIAESDLNDPRILWSPQNGGWGMDAQWSDDFHHALHTVLTREKAGYYEDFGPIADLAKALTNAFVYDGRHSKRRQRRHGHPPTGLAGNRFLGYLQNHDQIGNRAQGERTSQLLSPGCLKIGAALVLAAPFIPMLFQGEEWGASTPFQFFTDHQDLELGKAITEGRRKEFESFGWQPDKIPDPQDIETFKRSKLKWSELSVAPHAELLEWHRALIRLRREEPWLADGRLDRLQTRYDEQKRWLTVNRGPIGIVCNFAKQSQTISLGKSTFKVLLRSDSTISVHGTDVVLPGESVVILKDAGL